MGVKVLVTGGAGFIGSHVVDELVGMGRDVVALDDLSGGFRENVNPKAEFVEGSVTDVDLINSLFEKHKFTYVYHLAAYAAEGLSHFIRNFNYTNNLTGSINIINACVNHEVQCLVFTSSIAVYGTGEPPLTEETTPRPEDPYGIAKFAVELDLKAAHEIFGLNYVIFRPHNVYGERQNIGDKYRNVIGIFMNQIMQGKSLTIFGDGSQTRAFSYIGDVAPVIAQAPFVKEAYNEIFNVGADKPYTVKELAETVCESMGTDKNINYLEQRNEVVHTYSTHDKVSKVFNLGEETTLKEGIKRMADWASKAGAKKSKEFAKIEVLKNMPPSWLKK